MKRVIVEVLRDNGTVQRRATYEAPTGVRVGTRGIVEFGNEWGGIYFARVASLDTDYDGPCKTFRPTPEYRP